MSNCIIYLKDAAKKPKRKKKLSKAQKLQKKLTKRVRKMEKQISQLEAEVEAAEKAAAVSSRHVVGTDALVVVDAHYTGNGCGPFVSNQLRYHRL